MPKVTSGRVAPDDTEPSRSDEGPLRKALQVLLPSSGPAWSFGTIEWREVFLANLVYNAFFVGPPSVKSYDKFCQVHCTQS